MLRSKWVSVGLFALALLPPATWSFASGTYVLGDSIGDGLATTMGFNNLAQIGIHIRGPKALAQIERTPPGSTAYIFLGTNDAEGSLKNIDKSIDDILDAAAQRQLTVIWVGPHCVRKAWDKQASALDEILRAHLAKVQAADAKVKYIGTRDAAICSGKFHEPDGVHLTAKGYRYMWAMIDSAGGNSNTGVAGAPQKPNDAQKSNDADIATASLVPRLAPARVDHRLVMEIHVPGSPSEPLVWTRSQN
jgi:GDSL-like lipase/acylhydrolase family protein